jgi:hypothetical protein
MDAIERRVAWLAISLAVLLAFAASGSFAFGIGGIGTWELTFFVVTVACLGVSGVLLVASVVPASIRPFTLEERERFVFYAFALWALAIVVIVVLASHGAIEAHRHPSGLP